MYFDGKHDLWVRDKRKIVFNYLRGWFLLDLASMLPFDVIGILIGETGSAIPKLKVSTLIFHFCSQVVQVA